ncbi:hypothetical protein [Pseudomonas antarctica]|uniref:hypothetical protein n=1 Tax=Pseudomonas antarctica TaxID=219572 RepID=UPI003F7563A4
MQWIKKAWAGLSKTAKWLVLGVPTATAAITAAVPVIEQTSSLWKKAEARVEIIAPESVHVGDEFPVDVRVDSVGSAKSIPAGTVEIRTDQKYIKFTPSPTLGVPAIDGSTLVPLTTKLKALKVSDEPVSLVAYYRSGDIEATSSIRKIMIIPALVMNYPHFNKSDTNRVDLSGEWNIDFGGQSGTMEIRQATNSKISGTFRLPGYKWSAGSVEGYKDGSTFRVVFVLPKSKPEQMLRVAGDFRPNPQNAYIEIVGCAYHLKKSGKRHASVGGEGVDCTKQVFFDQWEVVQVAHFNASAKFVPE